MARTIWRETNPAFLTLQALLKEQREANRSARDPRGAEFCRTELMEPAKARLARAPPEHVTPIIGTGTEVERGDAVAFVETWCGVCGLCNGFERARR